MGYRLLSFLAVLTTLLWLSSALSNNATEAYYRRNVFYAGGEYSFVPSTNSTISINQIYVEQLTPLHGKKRRYPIVFFHGGGVSGAQWLNKPDGGRGWASYMLDEGYEVYIVDQWSVGRSSKTNLDAAALSPGSSVETAEIAFTAPERYNFYFQARFHTQWPGNGTRGDPIFDAFYATNLPLSLGPLFQNISRTSTCALLQRIGPSIFISHSYGGQGVFLATDGCPDFVKGHIAFEADQTPFGNYDAGTRGAKSPIVTRDWGVADVPISYDHPASDPSQLVRAPVGENQYTDGKLSKYSCVLQAQNATHQPRKLVNIARAPVLFLTTQASIHVTYDHCLVSYLRQAGVKVTFTLLEDVGIVGNGHFGMLERNSDDIAGYFEGWIRRTVR
ncbi:hypothetical protein Q9189_004699 [Teloschistes chrysophthalmus]